MVVLLQDATVQIAFRAGDRIRSPLLIAEFEKRNVAMSAVPTTLVRRVEDATP